MICSQEDPLCSVHQEAMQKLMDVSQKQNSCYWKVKGIRSSETLMCRHNLNLGPVALSLEAR